MKLTRTILACAVAAAGLLGPSSLAGATTEKVTICHATGSATNPFVMITVSTSAWEHGHGDHEDDVLATELEVLVDHGDNGRERFETVRFCPGAAPIPGPAGPKGPQGPIGPPGQDGVDGLNGTDGLNGLDGKNGKDGTDGANGLNAVQHNCVSADGYLYSTSYGCRPLGIVGEAGPQGERGEVGPQGPAGSPGEVFAPATVDAADSEPAGELAHTGSNDWLILGGLLLAAAGGSVLIARRAIR